MKQKFMDIQHQPSSGNVFADLGIPNPEEALAKADIASRIASIIKHRHLKQTEAAELLGIDQPKVSKLIRGQLREFSLERLLSYVLKLNRDVEIVIHEKTSSRSHAQMKVTTA